MIDAAKKARLTWQCRRGMLELDLMLKHFIDNYWESLAADEIGLLHFEQLLAFPDPELFSWLMGQTQPSTQELADLVQRIQLLYHARKI